jgi:hypothetical protein
MHNNHLFCAVHFWAPAFKWGISIANIADFTKPPEKISYPQQIGMHMNIELHVVLSIADFSLSHRCTCALLFNFHTCENVYFWNLCKEQTCASEWIYGMPSTRVATCKQFLTYILVYDIYALLITFVFNTAVMATGLIWSRYSTQITPVSFIFTKTDCF